MFENRAVNRPAWSKGQFGLLAGNIILGSVALALFLAARSDFFCFEIALRASRPGTIQLSYDAGGGIGGDSSARARVGNAESVESFRFPLPAGEYRAVRLDLIGNEDRRIILRQLRIVDRSGRVVHDFSPVFSQIGEKNNAESETSLFFSEDDTHPTIAIRLGSSLALQPSAIDIGRRAGQVFLFPSLLVFSLAGLYWRRFRPSSWTNSLLLTAPLLGAFLAFVFLLTRSRYLAPLGEDERFFIFYGWLFKNGAVPYRDFIEPKPPVIFIANALGLSLFGLKDCLFRIVPTGFAVASIAFLFVALIRRRLALWLSTLLTAQVALWLLGNQFHDTGLNDCETYGFAFTLFGFSLGTFVDPRRAGFHGLVLSALSGVCLGLAVLSKEMFVLSVIPTWLMGARHSTNDLWDWRYLWVSAAGGIAVGLLFLAYLVTNSAVASYLHVLHFSRIFAANYCLDLGRFPTASGVALIQQSWAMLHAQLYNFRSLAFVFALVLALLLRFRRKDRSPGTVFIVLTAALAVLLGAIAISVGHCFWWHYYLMGTMGLFLLSLVGAEALNRFLSSNHTMFSFLAFALLTGLFVFVAIPETRAALAERLSGGQRVGPVDPVAIEAINRHSKPGDYILDTDSAFLYVVTGRKSPLPIVGFMDEFMSAGFKAGIPAMQVEHLRNTLEQHLPKVCKFSSAYRPRQEICHRLLFDPFLEKHGYIRITDSVWYLPETKN